MPKRRPAKKTEVAPCGHERQFPMPIFAQRPNRHELTPDGALHWDVVDAVVQLWGCPDCLMMRWKLLPVITDKRGGLFPDDASDYISGQIEAYLAAGESNGRRREMWRKLVNKREAEKGARP